MFFAFATFALSATYTLARDGNKYVSSHFKVREFRCKDGSDTILIDSKLVTLLEKIRSHFGAPITINSGYRTPAYNKKIGGASASQHCKGTAADIVVSGYSPSTVYSYCNQINPNGGVGKYNSFTHVDTRGYRARW